MASELEGVETKKKKTSIISESIENKNSFHFQKGWNNGTYSEI